MVGVSVEEAMRLMRDSADVLQIGSLMLTHASVRELQLAGFDALGRVWEIFTSASSSSTPWRFEVAEGYIEAVVGGMRAHLADLEVQRENLY